MSEYQVIARKWRPQRFGDVVGQQHVVRTLENAIRQQRTAHAYLFVGPRGVGKTTLARIFAKAMNCLDPQDGEPCCRCESCRAIAEERSLDVMEVDAASRNTTGDMRELAEDVLTQPVGGRYKIYIIDEVHMLSKQAWNVLLKTVEEPPAHVKFIFATTEVHQVLPTIISRCQRFDLLPIPTRLITERLRLICDSEQVKINDSAIGAIARAAEGGMRDAQSLLDQMIAFFSQGDDTPITGEQVLSLFGLTDRTDLDALMVAMLRNAPGEVVSIVSRLARKGKNLETLFDDLLEAMRAVQLCAILPDPSDLIDEGEEAVARYRKLAALAKPDTIQILLEIIAPVGRVLHDALNKQVYLETILLKSMREAHAVRIDDLLARLNQLRTAGELKFIDQLPPVVKRTEAAEIEPLKPQPEAPAPAPGTCRKGHSSPGSAGTRAGTGHNGSCAASGSTGPHAAACCRGKRPCSGSSRACAGTAGLLPCRSQRSRVPAPQLPEQAPAAPEPESEPVEPIRPLSAPSPEPPEEEPAPPAPPAVERQPVPEPTEEPEAEPEPVPPNQMPEVLAAQVTEESDLDAPGRKKRHSIANDNPKALEEAVNDPFIHEVVDLFGGSVVDIHPVIFQLNSLPRQSGGRLFFRLRYTKPGFQAFPAADNSGEALSTSTPRTLSR